MKGALPECSLDCEHLRVCGRGVSSYERIPLIKIPVHEEPNEVVDHREKQGGIDRSEPHRIRIDTLAGGGQRLPDDHNKLSKG